MRRQDRVREDRIVVYSRFMKRPEDWLHFVHFPFFTARWRETRFNDDDLRALETLIMAAPARAPVIPGTGGLRKIRFARSDGNRGKSAGARIAYAYVPEYDTIGIFAVYTKDQQDDLSSEQKQAIREGIRRFKAWLESTSMSPMNPQSDQEP
jgi:hypothetical protein